VPESCGTPRTPARLGSIFAHFLKPPTMPEGPSILILKEKVQQFKGDKVIHASCNNNMLDPGVLTDQTITGFKSWGKHFLICFPKFTVRIHMMMFGTYRINEHTEKPPRLHLQFEDVS
jgi:endonuclease-8